MSPSSVLPLQWGRIPGDPRRDNSTHAGSQIFEPGRKLALHEAVPVQPSRHPGPRGRVRVPGLCADKPTPGGPGGAIQGGGTDQHQGPGAGASVGAQRTSPTALPSWKLALCVLRNGRGLPTFSPAGMGSSGSRTTWRQSCSSNPGLRPPELRLTPQPLHWEGMSPAKALLRLPIYILR